MNFMVNIQLWTTSPAFYMPQRSCGFFSSPLSDSEVIFSPLEIFYSQPDAGHILKVAPVANITAAYHKFTW